MFVVERKGRRTGTFYLEVRFRAGAVHEAPSKAGISHILEHLLFKSKGGELQRELSRLGGRSNASTGMEYTSYFLRVPAKEAASAIRTLKRVVSELFLDERILEEEKRVVMQERAYTQDRMDAVYEELFRSTPFSKSVIGTRKSIEAITVSDLRNYHRERYIDGGCYVVASCPSGATRDVSELLKKEFASFGVPPRDPLVDHLRDRNTLTLMVFDTFAATANNNKKAKNSSVEVARKDPPPHQRSLSKCAMMFRSRPRKDARDALLDRFVAFALFASGMGSALYDHMRDEHQLTYSVSGGHMSYTSANVLSVEIQSETDILYVTSVLRDRLSEIRRKGLWTSSEAFSESKEAFKNALTTSFASDQQASADIVLDEAVTCQRTRGCHALTGTDGDRKKGGGELPCVVVESEEVTRRVADMVDGFTRKEGNELTSEIFGGSRLLAVFGNNTTRTDARFVEDLKALAERGAKDADLRLRTVVFDGGGGQKDANAGKGGGPRPQRLTN